MRNHILRTPKRTVGHARRLRKYQETTPEHILWEQLRGRRLQNLKFRRQVPIGPFIADFLCSTGRLIIELDGKGHSERQKYDQERTLFLEQHGYRVIRFTNNEVFENLERVLRRIAEETARFL